MNDGNGDWVEGSPESGDLMGGCVAADARLLKGLCPVLVLSCPVLDWVVSPALGVIVSGCAVTDGFIGDPDEVPDDGDAENAEGGELTVGPTAKGLDNLDALPGTGKENFGVGGVTVIAGEEASVGEAAGFGCVAWTTS